MAPTTTATATQTIENVEDLRDLNKHLCITEQTAALVGDNGDIWRISDHGILRCLTRPGKFIGEHGGHIETDGALAAYLPLTLLWTGEHRP